MTSSVAFEQRSTWNSHGDTRIIKKGKWITQKWASKADTHIPAHNLTPRHVRTCHLSMIVLEFLTNDINSTKNKPSTARCPRHRKIKQNWIRIGFNHKPISYTHITTSSYAKVVKGQTFCGHISRSKYGQILNFPEWAQAMNCAMWLLPLRNDINVKKINKNYSENNT